MKTFRQTRNYKFHQAKEIAKALAALANPPVNIDDLDWNEMKYDPSTSTAFKLRHWYEDQLLDWFEHVNKVMRHYPEVSPRISDVKRLMSGMSLQDVCKLFVEEYEKYGGLNNGKEN